jgi:hypothetical protein
MLDPGMGAVAAGDGAMSEPDHGSSQPAQRSGVRTTLPHEELGSLNDTVLARNRMTGTLKPACVI